MAKEMELTSKTYKEIRIVPTGAKLSGEMQLSQKTLGFYLSAFTTAMLALGQSATLITEAEIVQVVKNSSDTWIAGDPIFWLEATSNYTNVDDGSGYLVGKALQAAGSGVVIGFIQFRDFYPVQRGHQVGDIQIPYKMTSTFSGPIFSMYAINNLGAGTVDGNKFVLTQGLAQTAGYVKALRVHLESDVKLPASGHAIYGKIDLKTSGHVHGMVAAVGAELVMPNSQAVRGTFYAMEAQIGVPANADWLSAGPLAFMRFGLSASGGALTKFEANGFLFDFTGVSEGSGQMFDTDESGDTPTGGIRILVNGTIRHISYI